MSMGMSVVCIMRLGENGLMTATTPSTSNTSIRLLPSTSPMASCEWSFSVEVMQTTRSGVDEPMATIVSPITSSGTLNFLATAEAPSVRILAPQMMRKRPPRKNSISWSMVFQFIGSLGLPKFLIK